VLLLLKSGRQDLNLRPLGPESRFAESTQVMNSKQDGSVRQFTGVNCTHEMRGIAQAVDRRSALDPPGAPPAARTPARSPSAAVRSRRWRGGELGCSRWRGEKVAFKSLSPMGESWCPWLYVLLLMEPSHSNQRSQLSGTVSDRQTRHVEL